MVKAVDGEFNRFGVLWRRAWIGDNAGWYLWTSDCGRMKVRRWGKDYAAQVDGRKVGELQPSLLAAMDLATIKRGRHG